MPRSQASLSTIVVILLTFVIVGCSPSGHSELQAPDQIVKDARTAFDNYIETLNQGDYDSASRIYDVDPDFHWIERGGIQYTSGAEAAASLQSFKGNGGRARMTTDQIVTTYLSPTSIFVSTHFDFAMLGPDDDIQFTFDGWMSVAMVKKQNRWVFAAGQVGPGRAENP